MIIKIDDNFHIDADSYNYTLIETYTGKDKDGNAKEQARTHGYFQSVEHALTRLARIQAIQGEGTTAIANYLKTLQRTTDALIQAVQNVD